MELHRGNKQTSVPMFNSECGNVWGYQGSTGDVDWSWDYHIMMNEFRKHPKVAGWLYTEHHDVINEWNGYYKFDRTEKFTGFADFIPDMELKHLHSDVYLSTGSELCRIVRPDAVSVPLYLSVMTDQVPPDHYILDYELSGRDHHGKFRHIFLKTEIIESLPWFKGKVTPLSVKMPDTPGLYHLTLRLRDENAYIYHLNFTSFLVEERNRKVPKCCRRSEPILCSCFLYRSILVHGTMEHPGRSESKWSRSRIFLLRCGNSGFC